MTVKRTYVGGEAVYYPTLGIHADPGAEVTFALAADVPDDGMFDAPPPDSKPPPDKPAVKSTPAEETTP